MSLHLRATIALLLVSLFGFIFLKKLTKDFISTAEFKQWRNGWLLITASAFLSPNFWIFGFITLLYAFTQGRRSEYGIILFCALAFVIPPISAFVPGFGLINYIFQVSYLRIISLTILLPIFFNILFSKKYASFGKYSIDLLMTAYFILGFVLELRDESFTEALRSLFYHFTDMFIPYYVISRTLLNEAHFTKCIKALFFAIAIGGFIGIAESLKGWLFYATLDQSWGLTYGMGNYLGRGDSLRAAASFGHPLQLSYVVSIAIGLYLYLQQFVSNNLYKRLGWLFLLAAIMAPLSRAGWVSAIIVYAVFLLTGKNPIGKLVKFGAFGVVGLIFVAALTGPEKVINLIPFNGKTDFNVEYRQKIIEVSLQVIAKNPMFGTPNYRQDPDMRALVQGEQIIDMLNTYMSVALKNGLAGLALFVSLFVITLFKLYQSIRISKQLSTNLTNIGRVLFSCIVATMFTIGSSGFGAATVCSLLIGLSMAYCQSIKLQLKKKIL